MKHRKLFTFTIFIFWVLVASCKQNPIFYIISTEKPLQKAYIPGTPTKMVVFEREYDNPAYDQNDPGSNPKISVPMLYVASGTKLHWYAKEGQNAHQPPDTPKSKWDLSEYSISQPKGKGRIIDIAASSDHLYALRVDENNPNATLWRIGHKGDWEQIVPDNSDAYPFIQTIYADPLTDRLFAGVLQKNRTDYAILFLDTNSSGNPELKVLISNTFMLTGAAGRTENGDTYYYLCTRDNIERTVDTDSSTRGTGIFQVAETALAAPDFQANGNAIKWYNDKNDSGVDEKKRTKQFMGMIRLDNDMIIAVERKGGTLYEVKDGAFSRMKYTDTNENNITVGAYSTGALTIWKDQDQSPKILTAGLQTNLYSDTSYTNGYVEFELNPANGSFKTDGTRNSPPSITVGGNTERYTTSIGQYIINYMFQAPYKIDEEMTFFASTQIAGLWSYRFIGGVPQWNAETNER